MKLKWVENIEDPLLKSLLTAPTSTQKLVLALYDNDIPVAAGYASVDSSKIQVEDPYFSTQSALKLFLQEIEKEALRRQLLSCIMLYSDELKQLDILQETLAHEGWSAPEKWMINCYFDHSFNPPWIKKEYILPPEIELKAWSSLADDQLQLLRHKGGQLVYPSNLSPFMYENPHPDLSLCLIHNQEVVGWMMTRHVDDTLIAFDSFFIEKSYRKPKVILALLQKSVKQVLDSPIPKAIMEVNLPQTENSYINFVYKRYIPFINNFNYTYRSWKLTGP
jgi:hypothetical protein